MVLASERVDSVRGDDHVTSGGSREAIPDAPLITLPH